MLLLLPPPEVGEEGPLPLAWEMSASARGPAAWRSSSSAASVAEADPLSPLSLPLLMASRAASRDSCSCLARCRGMGAAAVGRAMDLIPRAAHIITRAASRIASSRTDASAVDPRSASPGIIR